MEVNDHNANILFYRFRLLRPMCPKCRKRMSGRAVDMENFLKASYGFVFSDIFVILWYPHFSQFLVTLITFQDIVTTDHASDAR